MFFSANWPDIETFLWVVSDAVDESNNPQDDQNNASNFHAKYLGEAESFVRSEVK